MKVSVWDTYVQRTDGKTMHFDIIVPQEIKDEQTVFGYGNKYLESKNVAVASITAQECSFCHIEEASAKIENDIKTQGYHIAELNNC